MIKEFNCVICNSRVTKINLHQEILFCSCGAVYDFTMINNRKLFK